jgi:hypothetical protein
MRFGTLFIIDTSSKSSRFWIISKILSQSWFDQICAQLAQLQASLQFDQFSILDKEFTVVMYDVLTNITQTCTNNILEMKKISNF